jgi:Protein of unknown function (DUF3011)
MSVFLAAALVSFLAGCLLLPCSTHSSIVNAMPGQSMAPGANFNRSSNDMKRKYCPADTRGGVQLVYQRSGSPCTFGQTWGCDNRGIWVDPVAAPISKLVRRAGNLPQTGPFTAPPTT